MTRRHQLIFAIIALLCVLMALSFAANAGEGYGGNTANAGAVAGSVSGSSASQGNQQNINFNSAKPDSSVSVNTVPTVYAPSIGISAPCLTALSGGVAIMGFGASLGGSKEDFGCTRRETARILYEMGAKDAGLRVMCGDTVAREALGFDICGTITDKTEGQ